MARQFDNPAALRFEEVGDVVAPQAGVVEKTMIDQLVGGIFRIIVERRAPAARLLPGHLADRLDLALEPIELGLGA